MIASVATEHGVYAVDLDDGGVDGPFADELVPASGYELPALPRLLDARASGGTVLAAVDTKPPLVVSHDAGSTWRESGRGLPPIRAVAIARDDPDLMVAASRNRLHLSRDGGRFWETLDAELPEISSLALTDREGLRA